MALSDEMIEIADRDNLSPKHPMRIKADELNAALSGDVSAKSILGAWARAKRTYCDYTGKPLVDPVMIDTGVRLFSLLSGRSN